MGYAKVKACRFAGAKVGKKKEKWALSSKNSPYDKRK